MKKTYKVKNYKGNLVESLKKFSDSYKDMKIVHAYIDGDNGLKIKAEKIVNESFDDKHPKTAYTVRNNTRTYSHSDQPKEYGTYRTEEDAEKMRQWLARKDPSWRLENTEVVPKELDPMLPVHWMDVDGLEDDEENAKEINEDKEEDFSNTMYWKPFKWVELGDIARITYLGNEVCVVIKKTDVKGVGGKGKIRDQNPNEEVADDEPVIVCQNFTDGKIYNYIYNQGISVPNSRANIKNITAI